MKLDKAKVAYFLDEKEMKPGDEILSRLAQEIKQRKHYLLPTIQAFGCLAMGNK